ncbi:MAG TPA: hypothetical protein DEP51_04375 [Clostridiales bacterium]|nr:hypothetical protein [Clostridiales bacterium]
MIKQYMKKNKIIVLILLMVLLIMGLIIYKIKTKNLKNGNNISSQEIVDYILSINSYKSIINVQVNSNKNSNKYIIEQEYNTENGSVQKVIEPENIAGVKISLKDKSLKIENTNLSLSQMFENYQGLEDNSLDLISFIEDYKTNEKSIFEENENEVILKTKNHSKNRYNQNKVLYINKENKLPTKLIVEDDNNNTTINIKYNNIEIY